jgi:pilus assembly protein Flp/PilA
MNWVRKFWNETGGTTAIEYALIAMGIFLAIIVSIDQVGTTLNGVFVDVAAGFQN